MAVLFVPNLIGIAEIGASPAMFAEVAVISEGVSALAKGYAPVDTGAYRDSIQTDVVLEDAKATGRVFSDIDYAPFIEYGTVDTPTFAPLRRAADSFHI